MKIFSKSNDWGDPTSDTQLEIRDHAVTNYEKTNTTCINSAGLQFDGKGLGFTISSDSVFYFDDKDKKFIEYSLNADGSLTKEDDGVSVGSCGDHGDLKAARKPPNFETIECTATYNLVGAMSAPDTSLHGNPNHGAIAFYHRKTASLPWKLRGEIYGSTDKTKLGQYSLEFEDSHDLKAISERYRVNYVSDTLVSKKVTFHTLAYRIVFINFPFANRMNVQFTLRKKAQTVIAMRVISLLILRRRLQTG